ncbi:hypothetical protein HanHA89_Chr11g0441981 [Helianthus annuus]|nr:hypothetical protein HanHA89_Chr11g0441981 [Helianthus annuus]
MLRSVNQPGRARLVMFLCRLELGSVRAYLFELELSSRVKPKLELGSSSLQYCFDKPKLVLCSSRQCYHHYYYIIYKKLKFCLGSFSLDLFKPLSSTVQYFLEKRSPRLSWLSSDIKKLVVI